MKKRLARLQLVEAMGHLWPFLKPDRRWLVLVAVATLGLTAVEIAIPVLVGNLVDSLMSQLRGPDGQRPAEPDGKTIIVALLVGGALLRGFFIYVQRAIAGQIGQRVAARMRNDVWIHLQKLPLEYTRRRGAGRLLTRFISDARATQRLVARGIVLLAQDVLVVIGVLIALLVINWRMGLEVALVVPAVGLVFWITNPWLQRTSRNMRRRRSRLSAHLNVRIKGLGVVKAYGRQEDEAWEVKDLNRRVAKHGSRRENAAGVLLGASAGVVALVTVLVLVLATAEVAAGRLTTGELVTFYALLGLLAPVFQRITIADRNLQEAHISLQNLARTLSQPTESPREGELPPLEIGDGEVVLEGVTFDYMDGNRALEDVNLTARRGELVVITGPNGSGKSTLLELLPRFLQLTGGRILIDGQDISEVSLASLRTQIGLVDQSTPLLDGTIAENVTYGTGGEVTEHLIRRVAYLSGLDELVGSLPDGWETKIKEGRRSLSDGERQRVALARALVADPEIILLDQGMSAASDDTVRWLVERMYELAQEKTVIIASNRMPVLLAADRVYALEDGCALEVSAQTLQELHEKSPVRNGADAPLPPWASSGHRPVEPIPMPVPTRGKRTKDDGVDDDDSEEDDE